MSDPATNDYNEFVGVVEVARRPRETLVAGRARIHNAGRNEP